MNLNCYILVLKPLITANNQQIVTSKLIPMHVCIVKILSSTVKYHFMSDKWPNLMYFGPNFIYLSLKKSLVTSACLATILQFHLKPTVSSVNMIHARLLKELRLYCPFCRPILSIFGIHISFNMKMHIYHEEY